MYVIRSAMKNIASSTAIIGILKINIDTVHYMLFCFQNPYECGTWRDVFHCRPDNMCSHTARLTTMMHFNCNLFEWKRHDVLVT